MKTKNSLTHKQTNTRQPFCQVRKIWDNKCENCIIKMFQLDVNSVIPQTLKKISKAATYTISQLNKANEMQKPQLVIEWFRNTMLTLVKQL